MRNISLCRAAVAITTTCEQWLTNCATPYVAGLLDAAVQVGARTAAEASSPPLCPWAAFMRRLIARAAVLLQGGAAAAELQTHCIAAVTAMASEIRDDSAVPPRALCNATSSSSADLRNGTIALLCAHAVNTAASATSLGDWAAPSLLDTSTAPPVLLRMECDLQLDRCDAVCDAAVVPVLSSVGPEDGCSSCPPYVPFESFTPLAHPTAIGAAGFDVCATRPHTLRVCGADRDTRVMASTWRIKETAADGVRRQSNVNNTSVSCASSHRAASFPLLRPNLTVTNVTLCLPAAFGAFIVGRSRGSCLAPWNATSACRCSSSGNGLAISVPVAFHNASSGASTEGTLVICSLAAVAPPSLDLGGTVGVVVGVLGTVVGGPAATGIQAGSIIAASNCRSRRARGVNAAVPVRLTQLGASGGIAFLAIIIVAVGAVHAVFTVGLCCRRRRKGVANGGVTWLAWSDCFLAASLTARFPSWTLRAWQLCFQGMTYEAIQVLTAAAVGTTMGADLATTNGDVAAAVAALLWSFAFFTLIAWAARRAALQLPEVNRSVRPTSEPQSGGAATTLQGLGVAQQPLPPPGGIAVIDLGAAPELCQFDPSEWDPLDFPSTDPAAAAGGGGHPCRRQTLSQSNAGMSHPDHRVRAFSRGHHVTPPPDPFLVTSVNFAGMTPPDTTLMTLPPLVYHHLPPPPSSMLLTEEPSQQERSQRLDGAVRTFMMASASDDSPPPEPGRGRRVEASPGRSPRLDAVDYFAVGSPLPPTPLNATARASQLRQLILATPGNTSFTPLPGMLPTPKHRAGPATMTLPPPALRLLPPLSGAEPNTVGDTKRGREVDLARSLPLRSLLVATPDASALDPPLAFPSALMLSASCTAVAEGSILLPTNPPAAGESLPPAAATLPAAEHMRRPPAEEGLLPLDGVSPPLWFPVNSGPAAHQQQPLHTQPHHLYVHEAEEDSPILKASSTVSLSVTPPLVAASSGDAARATRLSSSSSIPAILSSRSTLTNDLPHPQRRSYPFSTPTPPPAAVATRFSSGDGATMFFSEDAMLMSPAARRLQSICAATAHMKCSSSPTEVDIDADRVVDADDVDDAKEHRHERVIRIVPVFRIYGGGSNVSSPVDGGGCLHGLKECLLPRGYWPTEHAFNARWSSAYSSFRWEVGRYLASAEIFKALVAAALVAPVPSTNWLDCEILYYVLAAFVWLFAIMLVAARPFRFLIDNVLGAALCVVTGLMCIHAANASFAAMVSLSDLLDALLYTAGVSVVASTCHWLLETCVLKRRVNPFVALLEQEMTDVVTKSCETLEEEAGPTTRLPTLHPPPLCPTSSSPRRRQHSGGDASSNSAGSSLPPALKLSLTSSSSLERSGNSSASASTMRPPLASRGGAAPGGGAVAASASLSTYAFIFAEPSSPTARGRGGPPPPPPSPPVAAAAPSASAVTMDWGDDDEEAPRTIAPFTATMSTTMRTTPTEATLSLAAIMAEDNDDGVPRTISEPTMTFVFVEDTGASDEGDAFRTPTSTTTTVQTAREEKG